MIASSPLLDEVLSWFEGARQNGTGVMVRCPNHEDKKQSLHISLADDGKILMKCHAGCDVDDVLARVGKATKDLFPPRERKQARSTATPHVLTAYDYVDEDGNLLYQAVRKQYPDRKEFFQRKPKPGGGWDYSLGDVRRVLYRLPQLLAAGPDEVVLVLEGEKDCDRAAADGWITTTSVGGAGKWSNEHSESLTGRHVVLIPDNDLPGFKHMLQVAHSLDGKAASTTIAQLTGVPEKGDLSDYLDAGGRWDDLERLFVGERSSILGAKVIDPDELAALAGEVPGKSSYVHCSEESAEPPGFPVSVFPDAIRRYIEDGSASINVPPDMIAVPFLGFAAGVIGNTRALLVRPGWIERPNLWLAVIGEPGSGKSPAIDHARQPLDDLQTAAWKRHQAEMATWEEAETNAKAAKGKADPLPPRPVLEHYFTSDATTEALASILSTSPGVAVVRDELVGWVKSMDAYRKGGDRQNYLSLWAGAPLKVDRKGTAPLYVSHPCVPIVGGIQPELLSDLGEDTKRHDGFVDRILMVHPTPRPIRWNEATVDTSAAWEVGSIFRQLRIRVDASESSIVRFTNEAQRVFISWFNENGRITEESRGIAAGCYSKYPSQLARIALVLHALRYPADPSRPLDAGTLSDAITVIEYLRVHLVKILPSFEAVGSTKSAGLATRILRVLDKAGGEWVARRDLSRGLGNSVPAEEITTVLDLLEGEGLVENRTIPTGSRPRQESRHLSPNNEHMSKSPNGRSSYRPNNEQMNNSPDDEEEGEEIF